MALVRAVQANGGFAAVLMRGDADRGALVLAVRERDRPAAVLERRMDSAFRYRWDRIPGGDDAQSVSAILENRRRSDPDCWLIELDIADAERFIAETIASG